MSASKPAAGAAASTSNQTFSSEVSERTKPSTAQNPALRALGLPRSRFRLPSRNWLIFLIVTSSFASAVGYDRFKARLIRKRWCDAVSHLAHEPLPTRTLPRRIRVFLCAPPGDGLGPARAHFKEFVEPILGAAALEWELVEGKSEGEVAERWAAILRRTRWLLGEETHHSTKLRISEAELWRQNAGIKEADGVAGDLVIGRNSWKEYIRGLHLGWLGPIDEEPTPKIPSSNPDVTPASSKLEPTAEEVRGTGSDQPYSCHMPLQGRNPTQHELAQLSPVIPNVLGPVSAVPYPHILGFLNTPTRIYRFLTKRVLTDDIGRQVADLCLAAPQLDADDPLGDPHQKDDAIQDSLRREERDWPQNYRKGSLNANNGCLMSTVWADELSLDPRITSKLRFFGSIKCEGKHS